MGVALALRARSVRELGGSGGMLPQKNFGFLNLRDHFWCVFEGKSEASGRLDGEVYLSMIWTQHSEIDRCRPRPRLNDRGR